MLRHVAMLNPLVWMSEPATQTGEHVRPAGENGALLCCVRLTFGHHSVQDLLQLEHGDLTVLQTDRRVSGTSDSREFNGLLCDRLTRPASCPNRPLKRSSTSFSSMWICSRQRVGSDPDVIFNADVCLA